MGVIAKKKYYKLISVFQKKKKIKRLSCVLISSSHLFSWVAVIGSQKYTSSSKLHKTVMIVGYVRQ